MSEVTQILNMIETGDPSAAEQLLPLVYEELRKLAAVRLAQETPGQTIQPTALVHDAYLKLVDTDKIQHWNSRGHFFGAAAEAMRRILVDNAKRKQSVKRGGQLERVDFDEAQIVVSNQSIDLIALDEALNELAVHDSRKAEIVKLRFFAGLTMRQAANALQISESTADADWAYAKAWLRIRVAE
jgi:RNA polymerase sigma factor (TIGR02999 family)